MQINSKAIVYKQYGDPRKVLECITTQISTELEPGEVLIQWLASPINPLDINRIEGKYPIKADFPAVGGSEGVGKIIKVTTGSKFKKGDLVTIFSYETPFWCEYGVANENDLVLINKRIDLATAATFMINPPTAWVMLTQFVKLEPGDYVIQNAANSGVGRNVIQICKAWGIKTINIIRSRPNVHLLKTELWRNGADHVFTEEEFQKNGRKFLKTIKKPRLALNGVGGKSVLAISSVLEYRGHCIVYGGMSKKTHELSTSALVFNDITVKGVSIGVWMRRPENKDTFVRCMDELEKLAVKGQLFAPPMNNVHMDNFHEAISKTISGGQKQLLLMKHSIESKL